MDPTQQTALGWPQRSHWLQPWRAYIDTVPAGRIHEAVGINLNVDPAQADAVCRHLAAHGFRRARIEFGWGSIAWDDPKTLADPARFDTVVRACKRYGIRPLFLLNAHHGAPCPVRFLKLRIRASARKGDRTVKLEPGSIASVVAGHTGLSQLTDYWAAEALITAVDPDGTAHLSKPLPKDIPAGDADAATLKFLPFYPSRLRDGRVPPEFEETMGGWLDYVEAITSAAKRALGTDGAKDAGFDLEVWNELTFGSSFLSINNYYSPAIADWEWAPTEILRRTVAWVADPARGLPRVGVSDGFNNQWPWGAGSTAPPGLAALGKHPYAGVRRFPQDQAENNQPPLDALGGPDGTEVAPGRWRASWTPTYVSHFPEYFLTAIQAEHLIRDLSPITTAVGDVKHGRSTRPVWPDGRPAPAPQMWITEVNLDPGGADPGDLSAYVKGGQKPVAPGLTPADADRMKAKAVLRYLASFTNKGPVRFYFFAARDSNPLGLGLVSRAFFDYLKSHQNAGLQDDSGLTSPTLAAVRRLLLAMPAGSVSRPRSLALLRIEEDHGHMQFTGDPATVGLNPNPHPALYNRDVLAFLPFQCSGHGFAIAVYVMTRNLARLYKPAAPSSDATRFDLPAERYRLTIGGIRGHGARVSLYDPVTDARIPTRVMRRGSGSLTVDVPLTDSVRLLRIQE